MADSASLAFIQQVVADERGPLDAWAVLDALGTLVDRSLVAVLGDAEHEHEPNQAREAREPRYRLLESPRLFAIEQLQAAGEEQVLRRRHATALAAAFDAAWDDCWSGRIGAQRWASRILLDASNARDAIAWARAAGEAEATVAIAATLYMALPRSSHAERMALADLCETLAEGVASRPLRLRAWGVAVRPNPHRHQQQSLDNAVKALRLAREFDRDAPDRWPLYWALSLWIRAAAHVSHPSPDALREALAELAALEDPHWPAQRLSRGLEAMRLARPQLGGLDQPTEQLLLTRRMIAAQDAEGAGTLEMMASLIDAEIACGHTHSAVRLGEQVLEQLAGTRDEWSRAGVRANLAVAWLALDDTARARPLLQVVWPAALHWNWHVWCSDYPALLAALEGRPRAAAQLTGYADAAYAARGLVRQPNEMAARERSHALACAALGDATFDHLLAEGRGLRDEQIAALAFATEDSR